MKSTTRHSVFISLTLLASAQLGSAQASFTPIGVFPGGSFGVAMALSGDGTTVVGRSESPSGLHAFRWTQAGGLQGLGSIVGLSGSEAQAVSWDGSVIAGIAYVSGETLAMRWTNVLGLATLPLLSAANYHEATGISADGLVVGGFIDDQGARWTGGANPEPIGYPAGSNSTVANAVSGDGRYLVGEIEDLDGDTLAMRWTPSAGVEALATPSNAQSFAYGSSFNGNVIVGETRVVTGPTDPQTGVDPVDQRAFRWTPQGGMENLGTLFLGQDSLAQGVSPDGTVVVGRSDSFFGERAFFWLRQPGMQDVQQNLIAAGLGPQLQGWELTSAEAVTIANGQIIVVGTGEHNGSLRGYRATLPAPPYILPVSGTVTVLGLDGSLSGRRLSLTVSPVGSSVELASLVVTLGPNGQFQTNLPNSILPGAYDIALRGGTILRKKRSNVSITPLGVSGLVFPMFTGDVDSSGEVDLTDIDIVISNYLSSEALSDLDASGEVDLTDVDIVIANYLRADE